MEQPPGTTYNWRLPRHPSNSTLLGAQTHGAGINEIPADMHGQLRSKGKHLISFVKSEQKEH